MRLPKIFLVRSSRSCNATAATINTTTTLKVVIAETILRFPTTNIKTTHERDWKNRNVPVMTISFEEYTLLLPDVSVAIHKKRHWLHQEIIVPAVNPVIFWRALSAVKDTQSKMPLKTIIKKYLSNLNVPTRCFLETVVIPTRSKQVHNICVSVRDSWRKKVASKMVTGV